MTENPAAAAFGTRINYEDTDAAGVVYYANYLGFMERARNAWLRELGFSLTALRAQFSVLFAVTEARVRYIAAAKLEDEISITTQMQAHTLKPASFTVQQNIYRRAELLVAAEIKLAALNCQTFKPIKLPNELEFALKNSLASEPD